MADNNVGIIIAVRTQSQRLPNKCLVSLNGVSVLWHIIDRCSQAKTVDKIVVATTTLPEDDPICREVEARAYVDLFRGDPVDVYGRVRAAAEKYNIDTVVRITADCPLVDPNIIDKTVRAVTEDKRTYAASRLNPDAYPDGLDVEVFPRYLMTDEYRPDRSEDITAGIKKHCRNVSFGLPLTKYGPLGHKRWTLDTPEDLAHIRKIYDHFGWDIFGWEDVLAWEDECAST
jgi:spore coat polysaccharide biosynthesis protein SpsF (cytidylyltransferase family)